MMRPLAIRHYTATTAAGNGCGALLAALRAGRSGLRRQRFENSRVESWIGLVDAADTPLPPVYADWDCRNHRLAMLALEQDGFSAAAETLRERMGGSRIGVFIGTSTSGVLQTEHAYRAIEDGHLPPWFRYRNSQNVHAPAALLAARFGLTGPCVAISTACSSSAKVFASAARAIRAGICDAAIVGGVDSLCLTTLHGFDALQLIADDICRPADVNRSGISLGEAAGFAIIERDPAIGEPALLGYGESSDAHHMSAPDPEGRGAATAMREALLRSGRPAIDIDYVNLHGTGTPANDVAEDRGFRRLFPAGTPCSSTKGWTGHTLGAAGIVEAVIALLCIEHGLMPASLNTGEVDPQIHGNILLENREARVGTVLSNSFGFGGSNCSLLFGRAA